LLDPERYPEHWREIVDHVGAATGPVGVTGVADLCHDLVSAGWDELAAGQRPAGDLLTHRQVEFLGGCAANAVNLEAVTTLPAISAVRWKTVPVASEGMGLRAERWTVGRLDFLELSLVASVDEASPGRAPSNSSSGPLHSTFRATANPRRSRS